MSGELIRIEKNELHTPAVEEALALERSQKQRVVIDPPPVSFARRLLLNSMFHLPVAAFLGALVSWLLIEPRLEDGSRVAGAILLENYSPMAVREGLISFTIGPNELLIDPTAIELAPGEDGQPPFEALPSIKPGVYADAIGIQVDGNRMLANAIRPITEERAAGITSSIHAHDAFDIWFFLFFPLTGTLIALGLLIADGVSSRNWRRMVARAFDGSLLAAVFCLIAYFPAGIAMMIGQSVLEGAAAEDTTRLFVSVNDVAPWVFVVYSTCRSIGWAFIGAGLGFGMNLRAGTKQQSRNAVIGGALGGALGGLFFDPISRFIETSTFGSAAVSRLIGVLAVGVLIGVFVALVERLGREAWLRVRTGPLAGKSFILYKTPTGIGSSPQCDVYLFKDAQIEADHARIHRVGMVYEIEDAGTRAGTVVGQESVRRRRLVSGDQIVIGDTVLEFEERMRRNRTA